jgi:hypothetical protein
MDGVVIARFRSTFIAGRGVLTAELTPRPTARWLDLCEANLARYSLGFEYTPDLVSDAIVVSTTPNELAMSEMALRMVVMATNQVDGHEGFDRG